MKTNPQADTHTNRLPEIVSAGPQIGSSSSSSKFSSLDKKFGLGFCSGIIGLSVLSTTGGAGSGFIGRLKSLEVFIDFRGGIGGASSWTFAPVEFLCVGLSLEVASINGTLLMLFTEEVDEDDDDDDELPDEDELTIGGGFDGFPFD